MLEVELNRLDGRITLPRYPFPARKTRVLERAQIIEIIDWFPPAILTTDGEFLFITREQLDDIKAFCAAQSVPFTQRHDVWGNLLEPFLDTEFSPDTQEQTRERIRTVGLTDTEIDAIRARVETRMLWLTSLTWEWQHYGLYDVLTAMKHPLPFMRWGWRAFYAEAINIARRGIDADKQSES